MSHASTPVRSALLAAIGLAVGGFLKNQEGETDTASPSGPATPF